jgi:hypothetical protein
MLVDGSDDAAADAAAAALDSQYDNAAAVTDRHAPAPIPGLTARRLPLPRANIGDPRAAVTGGVNAGADTSQPSTAQGVGLLYPGSGLTRARPE